MYQLVEPEKIITYYGKRKEHPLTNKAKILTSKAH
jgi:hypothetical protein